MFKLNYTEKVNIPGHLLPANPLLVTTNSSRSEPLEKALTIKPWVTRNSTQPYKHGHICKGTPKIQAISVRNTLRHWGQMPEYR